MIETYLNQLKANNKSARTIDTYYYVLKRLNKFKPLDQMTKSDMIEFFSTFQGTEQTKRLFQGIIKKFYKDNGKEDIVKWVELVNPKLNISVNDILTVNDINSMIEATNSLYWKAYISVLFETGARFSELQNLLWSDYRDNILDVGTHKTMAGMRRIPLKMSSGHLDNLQLSVTALKDDTIFQYSEEWVNQCLKEIAVSAGITKPVSPHKFRHARATDLVARGTQEAIIRKIMGWTPSSTMIARYQHLNDNSVIDAMAGSTEVAIPEIISADNKLENLIIENHELRQDLEGMQLEVQNMRECNLFC
jgi:integrase/recombinase XerD